MRIFLHLLDLVPTPPHEDLIYTPLLSEQLPSFRKVCARKMCALAFQSAQKQTEVGDMEADVTWF